MMAIASLLPGFLQAASRESFDLSSSNFPKFEPNPNTGEPVGAWTHLNKAHNVVYHDARRPTYVDLPLAIAQ
jgi:predicted acyl esterase